MASANGKPVYVTVSALDAGHLTLPESLFVTDAEPGKRATVPSLAFLIQHPSSPPGRAHSSVTNMVFDLGIKRDLSGYAPAQEAHMADRRPIITDPDCAASLRRGGGSDGNGNGGLDPAADVDVVVLSHVHWDHVGTPSDFAAAAFVVGSGTLDLLRNGAGALYPADIFNDDELPAARTAELPPVDAAGAAGAGGGSGEYVEPRHTPAAPTATSLLPAAAKTWAWRPLAAFPAALDFFGDGSLWVVDAPGHLYGHINALARVGPRRYVYLGGDCCHDPRILRGEKGFATYDDGRGGTRSVHVHTSVARRTLDRIAEFVRESALEVEAEGEGKVEVEVVLAHDAKWREANRGRFWPGHL